jgi:HK97 family phage prohead protease
MTPELRTLTTKDIEVRESGSCDTTQIRGYATVFHTATNPVEAVIHDVAGSFRERVLPTAFDRVLREQQPTRLIVGHDTGAIPLARVGGSGTMRMQSDSHGLEFVADLSNRSTLARDVADAVRRQDLDGVSIGFALKPGDDRWSGPQDDEIREIVSVSKLFEISLTWCPAVEETSVAVQQQRMLQRLHALPNETQARIRRTLGKIPGDQAAALAHLLQQEAPEDASHFFPYLTQQDKDIAERIAMEAREAKALKRTRLRVRTAVAAERSRSAHMLRFRMKARGL